MRFRLLAVALTVLTFVPALAAQQVRGGPDLDRTASNVAVVTDSFETLAAVSISYSQPRWQDRYDGMLDSLKGNYSRLGKNWWTTLDTVGAIEVGGTMLEAGTYYLGLAIDKDGAFTLLVFDAKKAMQNRLLPFSTALYTGAFKADLVAPMTFARDARKNTVAKLEIEITADAEDPATGRLSIRWGKHELSAPVRFHLVTPNK